LREWRCKEGFNDAEGRKKERGARREGESREGKGEGREANEKETSAARPIQKPGER